MSSISKAKQHRRRRSKAISTTLNLTALVDMFTTLVFFLISSAQNPVQLPSMKNIEIPRSSSTASPEATALKIVVEKKRVLINDQPVMELYDNPEQNDYSTFAYALVTQRPAFKMKPSANGVMDRDVVLLGDNNVPFAVLRQIIRICGEQQFGRISFATKQEKKNA